MANRYIVTLTEEERSTLKEIIARGQTHGYRIKHAQMLLKLDKIPENKGWTYAKIGEAYQARSSTVGCVAQRYVEKGLESALGRKEQQNRHRKIDGNAEAHIVALACSEAPEGRERWTLQMIADEVVRLGLVDSLSDTAVLNVLKKTNSSRGRRKNGAFQEWEQSL